ncbi:MAG TPA: hypothetical protein VMW65_17105 [Chloroflexota bacterium]|nr:hypothetical protein [Chloroflexota bacterium]
MRAFDRSSQLPDAPADCRARRRGHDFVAILTLIGLSAFLTAALDHPQVRSDGFAYYLWLETLFRDHTLNLSLAVHHYAPFLTYQAVFDARTHRYVTQVPFGPALLWGPFYLLFARFPAVTVAGIPLHDPAYVTIQGQSLVFSLSVAFASWAYATVALVMWYAIARRILDVAHALVVTLAVFLGTPMYYYTAVEPTMAHAVATFAVTLTVWLVVRSDRLPLDDSSKDPDLVGRPGVRRARTGVKLVLDWALVGLTIGLAGTSRWQLVLLAIPVGILLLSWKGWKELLACGVGTALIFVTVPVSWLFLFGSPLPSAVGTVHDVWPSQWATVLFSPVAGLFTWSPITILSLIGLVVLAQRGQRRSALVLILGVAVQVLMNAMAGDGTGGSSFGMRRMTEMDPIFVIGLAILLRETHGSNWRRRGVYAATAFCTLFTLGLFFTYVRALIDPASGSVIDAIVVWLPPHTFSSFYALRTYHPFGFGT